MTTNALLLETILRRSGGAVAKTRLLKLAYMTDLLAWRVLGAPVSRFNYHWHNYGPFDAEFYSALDELIYARVATVEERTTRDGHDCELLRLSADGALSPPDSFTQGQLHLIDLVIRRYFKLALEEFLALVYATEPMKEAQRRNDPLPMEAQRNKDRDAAGGISLETILASRDAFYRGESISHEALKAELLGRS